MPSVSVTIGPAPGSSARTWLAAARRTMATVRVRPDLDVPDEVVDAFEGYLDLWSGAMDGDEFSWTGDVDPEQLRRLAAQWARLVAIARESGDAARGLEPADPEGAAFFDALAVGMADALARADDDEQFAPKFEAVVPPFDAVASSDDDGAGRRPETRLRRVLLVDDNPDIRMLVRIGLETGDGFDVVGEACDGQEAVAFVSHTCPDAVLLDLAMPVMDGFEALPLLLAACPDVRIVVFSASDSPDTRARVEASGSHAFLRKDAAISDVLEALRTA